MTASVSSAESGNGIKTLDALREMRLLLVVLVPAERKLLPGGPCKVQTQLNDAVGVVRVGEIFPPTGSLSLIFCRHAQSSHCANLRI